MPCLSEWEMIDSVIYELLSASNDPEEDEDPEAINGRPVSLSFHQTAEAPTKRTHPFQPRRKSLATSRASLIEEGNADSALDFSSFLLSFNGLNALEIASVSNAKKFLRLNAVQKIINGIWKGDIVFWDSLSVHSKKRPRKYNKRCDCL